MMMMMITILYKDAFLNFNSHMSSLHIKSIKQTSAVSMHRMNTLLRIAIVRRDHSW